MAIKSFVIQGADLTLGGVNLQAGATGVVIPGVTQATNYTVEEVNDTGNQTYQFAVDSEVVVVDAALYNAIVAQGNEGHFADYTATTDGEGYIDNIQVNGQGTYTLEEAATAGEGYMYAYVGAGSASDRPLVPQDWITIPFHPWVRAGAIENIGGGGSVDGLVGDTNYDPEFAGNISYSLDINPDYDPENPVKLQLYDARSPSNMGPAISLGANISGTHGSGVVAIGNDDVGYNSKQGGVYIGAEAGWNDVESNQGEYAIAIGAYAARNFAEDNSITLNATGEHFDPVSAGLFIKPIQEDIGNTTKALYYDTLTGEVTYADPTGGSATTTSTSNIWVQTFESATPELDQPLIAISVEYDAAGNIIALFQHINSGGNGTYYSVGKYSSTGTRIWTTRFGVNYYTDGWGLAVDQTSGFIYVAGSTNTNGGQKKSTLTKISGSGGSVDWSKTYDFGSDSSSQVVDVAADGNPVMVGYIDDADDSVTTTKIDADTGNIIWSRKLNGQGNEQAYGMAVGPSGEIVTVGYMSQFGILDKVATVAVEPTSNASWVNSYSVSSGGFSCDITFASPGNPTFSNIVDTTGARTAGDTLATVLGSSLGGVDGVDNMVIKVATLANNDIDDRMLLVKYNSAGVIQWQKAILFDVGYDSTGQDADIDSDGNIYVCGNYEYNGGPIGVAMSIIKFNSSGVKQWSRRIEGNCGAFTSSIVVGPDDKLYVSGVTFNINDDASWVLGKYTKDGQVEWQRLVDNTDTLSVAGSFFLGSGGGSNIAVKADYVAGGGAFGELNGPEFVRPALVQVSAGGDLFTVGSWDFKAASFNGNLDTEASDITVVNAGKTDTDNISNITTATVTPDVDSSNFLVGTLYSATAADSVGFTILADGSLQARAGVEDITTLTDTLTSGRPDWLSITPRSPDRETLDTHYGFDGSGMWFTGNNEETLIAQPAYPIHTIDSFPADVKTVVTFDFNYVDGHEDWGVCVYPADGVPHWTWDTHPSRIAAQIDLIEGAIHIYGLTRDDASDIPLLDPGVYTARFTYDPVAELSTFELINSDDEVISRVQLPGRLAQGQDYMIGFDADWDEAGPSDKSYFTNLTITSGNSGAMVKATELTVTGEVKLPNTNKGFVNLQGPWDNGDDDIQFQSVAAHDGYAYMLGEASWAEGNRARLDKYSLTTGELIWTKIIGAGRDAQFNISWDTEYSMDTEYAGVGYQVNEQLYISGDEFSGGDYLLNRATITVQSVGNTGNIETATITGTVPAGTGSSNNVTEYYSDARGNPTAIKYDTVNDNLVVLLSQYTLVGDADDNYWDRAVVIRINPVSGDVVSNVTLSDAGDINPYDVATHPVTGAPAVVGQKYNEYRQFGTLNMLTEGNGFFDILKSELDEEHWPGNQLPGEYYSDFWIEGTGIASKENVDDVNYYSALACSAVLEGSGTVDIDLANPSTVEVSIFDTEYATSTGSMVKNYDNIVTIGGWGNWLVFPDNALRVTITSMFTMNQVVPVTWSAGSTTTSGFVTIQIPGDGTWQMTPVEAGGANAIAGTWYFPVTLATASGLTVTVNAGGSNYHEGHKIKYLGTQLPGGATPANDIILTVTGVDGSGVITTATAAGTLPAGNVSGLSGGTNYNVGSGLSLDYYVDTLTGAVSLDGYSNMGSNYVVNDVVTIAGALFANGDSPANDITITIGGVDGSGAVTSVSATGTAPTNSLRIFVNGVDFTAGGGSWTMKQNLGGEAFVWTEDWHVPIGGPSGDRFQSVVYSKDGASIYAVGDGQYEVDYRQSLVVRYFTSDGTIDWSKFLNTTNNNAYATSVATIGTSDIVVSGYEYVGNPINIWKQFVARMSDNGTVLWKKYYNNTWGNDIAENSDIQIDSDDNMYVTMQYQADTPGYTYYGFHVTKLDQDGNVIWSRCINAPNDGSYLGNWNGNRWSSLSDDQLVIAGFTYLTADNYYSGLWASIPTDGFTYFGGEGEFVQQGAFRFSQGSIYTTEDLIPPTGSFTPEPQLPNITSNINLKKYETRTPTDLFEQHLQKMTDPKHGGLVFGDGSRQTFATDKVPQIKADRGYTITAQDSGKHIYYKNNSGTITIPAEDGGPVLPVGFTFTIINRTGGDCYVRLYDTQGPTRGIILGAGRNQSYYEWGIPDSGSGSMVTLIKLESLLISNGGIDIHEPVWMISGPSDIYTTD